MVYFTLFHLDPTSLISFDKYLVIAINARWCVVKWWLWICTYSSNSKWSDIASVFTIPSNKWWKILSQLEGSGKHRGDFILSLTDKEGYELERRIYNPTVMTMKVMKWLMKCYVIDRRHFREYFGRWQLRSSLN